jgi:hypothetical protein
MLEEGIKRDFKASEIERLRLYDEIMRPVKDHYDKCKREFFVGFAELVSIKPDRAEDFARGVGGLLLEARIDGVSRRETPHPHQPHTLTRAEAALRTALNAMAALSLEERARIGEVLWLQDDTKKIDEILMLYPGWQTPLRQRWVLGQLRRPVTSWMSIARIGLFCISYASYGALPTNSAEV